MSNIRKIFKYDLPITERSVVKMHGRFADICSIQLQGENLCIWALVDPEEALFPHFFCIHGTGHEIDQWAQKCYRATIQQRDFVWHVFEYYPQQ